MARWLRLWMSYLKTAGLAMAVFTALAFAYGAIRLGSDGWSLVAFGGQVLGLFGAVFMWGGVIRRTLTRWSHAWRGGASPADARARHLAH